MAEPGKIQLPQSLRQPVLRLGAVMFWGGSLAAAATLFHGREPDAIDRAVIAGCALLAFGGGAAAWFLPWHRWPRNRVLILTVGAITIILLALLASGGASSPYYMLLVLPVIFGAAYYGRREAYACAGLAALAGVVATLEGGNDHHLRFLIILLAVLGVTAGFQRLLVYALQSAYHLAESRRAELEESYRVTLRALGAALDAKDRYTEAHGRETAALCLAIGRRLGLSDRELQYLEYGALLHDIGKIGIPGGILNKPGPLTDDEMLIVREHPVIGERILSSVPFLQPVLGLVRHEHERFDGQGYPDGLKGDDIPVGARIIFACDAFDAMARDRPYRRALPRERVLAELRDNAGTQFDPKVVDALLAVLAQDQKEIAPVTGEVFPWAIERNGGPLTWAHHLDSVQTLGLRLARLTSVPEIARQVGEAIVRLVDLDQCRIWVASNNLLTPVYSTHSSRPEYTAVQLNSFQIGEGIVGWVGESRQGVLINDAQRHPRRRRTHPWDESVVAVPIVFGDDLLGVIAVVKIGLHQYHADHLRLLTILANQAAVSIANARMYERLAAEATTDPLSGLLNRRAMEIRLAEALCAGSGDFCLLLSDVDQLKRINDGYGHLAGDEALRLVAECTKAVFGADAILARWGGDEFLAMLPGADPAKARALAATLQAALASRPLTSVPSQRVSVSFGLAHHPGDGRQISSLLDLADRRMYAAKHERVGVVNRIA